MDLYRKELFLTLYMIITLTSWITGYTEHLKHLHNGFQIYLLLNVAVLILCGVICSIGRK